MVKYSEVKMDEIFSGLADPTRRDIIHRLVQKDPPAHRASEGQGLTVTEIAKGYDISMPAVSKHLRILERAELVSYVKKGREKIYSSNPKAIMEIQRYINFYTKFWSDRFDKLSI